MLTDKGLEAGGEFIAKTHAIIVTVTMSDSDSERLEMMLLDWKARLTEQKEQAIISEFAIVRESDGDEPGIDY
jgi:hypothetical protein